VITIMNAPAGGGGFPRVLGITYLVKQIRKRRQQRRQRNSNESTGNPRVS
jgi:hypothetical protein